MRAKNMTRALNAGLTRPSTSLEEKILQPSATASERSHVSKLWAACSAHAARANMESKEKRVATSIGKYEALVAVLPSLASFTRLQFEGDLETSEKNEAILCILAEHIRATPSANTKIGCIVKSGTVSGQVSAIKITVEEHLRRPIISMSGGRTLKAVLQGMRRQDGPQGSRKLSLPLGNGHIMQLASPSCIYDISSTVWACTRWALFHTMLHCLLRGGEPGTQPKTPFDPKTGLRWSDLIWTDPASGLTATILGRDRKSYYLLIIMIFPIKDVFAQHKRVPCEIRSKHPISAGLKDITCPYAAIRRSYCQRQGSIAAFERSLTPFFVTAQNKAIDTNLMLLIIREAARALHLNPLLYGSSAFRRGGATDLRDQLGSHEAKALITQRGRWCDKDISDIYARSSAREHAEASGAIGHADTATLESTVPGWIQPTRF